VNVSMRAVRTVLGQSVRSRARYATHVHLVWTFWRKQRRARHQASCDDEHEQDGEQARHGCGRRADDYQTSRINICHAIRLNLEILSAAQNPLPLTAMND